jgi:hypothetical protein
MFYFMKTTRPSGWYDVSLRAFSFLLAVTLFGTASVVLPACSRDEEPLTAPGDPVPDDGGVVPPPGGSNPYDYDGPAIWVSASEGTDTSDCGDPDNPCRTIKQGRNQSVSGMAVLVKTGEYHENFIYVRSGTQLIAIDGPLTASIYSGDRSAVRFETVSDASVVGFEIHGDWNQGPEGDGLVRVLDSSHILIKDCVIYDAPYDADCIKVSGDCDGLLMENLVVFNPAQRDPSRNPCGDSVWYQENIDIFGRGLNGTSEAQVRNVVLRDSWLFHTPDRGGDWLIYSKINCANILYENNVFGPSAGRGCANAAVGVGTEEPGIPDENQHVVRSAIVRNNIFVGIRGDAALGVMNADDVWIYNNTFWNNSGDALRSAVMIRGNRVPVGEVFFFNNILEDDQPTARADGRLFWVREGGAGGLYHDQNLYWNCASSSDLPYTSEAHSIYDASAGLSSPKVPSIAVISIDRVAEIARGFALAPGSPALDHGLVALDFEGHPDWDPSVTNVAWDIFGSSRSSSGTWDLGVTEEP